MSPLNLDRDKLRNSLRNENADEPAFTATRKPPTTSQRVERLRKDLKAYYSQRDLGSAVMAIVMTSLNDNDVKKLLDEGFASADGPSWRKVETLLGYVAGNHSLAVAAFEANLSYQELQTVLEDPKTTPETIRLMASLNKRADSQGLSKEDGKSLRLPALSSRGTSYSKNTSARAKVRRGRRS